MGRVYLARDLRLGRMVALKEAHDDGLARRLAREVRVTAGLEHPGIVTVYDEGRDGDGRLFYTMRLMRGRPLSQVLAERRGLGERLGLLAHYLDACQAIAYAHAQGVIHRDLKPANIMLGAFGETQVVDWGLARRLGAASDDPSDADTTRPGAILGTPAYMSPEQARGEPADRRSDVWGLGAVLHELLLGAAPVRDPPRDGLPAAAQRDGSPPAPRDGSPAAPRDGPPPAQPDGPPPDAPRTGPGAAASPPPRPLPREVPAELAAIVQRALASDPAARYRDAAALADDVAAYLEGRRVRAHHYTPLVLALRFARVWRVPLLVAAGALLVIASLLVLGNLRLRAQRDRALAAEDDVRAALGVSDRNLATALVAQARAADDRGDDAIKEVLAAEALRLVDSPEARGLIAGARASARPTRLATAELPDCRLLAALAVDDILCADDTTLRRITGGVERWRAATARPPRELRVEAGRVWAVALGVNLRTLSLATGEPDAEAWETVDFNVGDAWPLRVAAWAPGPPQPRILGACGDEHVVGLSGLVDGRFVVLCSDGRLGAAVGATTPTPTPAFDAAAFVSFTHLALAPDGQRVVVAGTQGRVAEHDLGTGRTWELAPDRANAVRMLVMAPAGDRVAVARERGGVELYALPGLRPLGKIAAARVRDLRLFADGSVLLAGPTQVTQWALPGAPRPRLLADDHGLSGVQFAPDGATLVTTHGEGRALLWDLATGVRRHDIAVCSGTVKSAAFLPDGSGFAVVDASPGPPGPHVFDVATGALRWRPSADLLAHWRRLRGGALAPDQPLPLMARRVVALAGDVLVFALYAPGVLAADVDRGADVPTVDCPALEWLDLAGAPDGSRAVLVSADATVYILEAGPPLRCRPVAAPAGTASADVASDGASVVLGGGRFLARSGPAGLRWTVAHPGPGPLDVSLSPDERWVASAGPDELARVFDARTGALRAVLSGHQARVSTVDFSRDGATLATGSWDGTARLWDLASLDAPVAVLVREAQVTWGLALTDALGGVGSP